MSARTLVTGATGFIGSHVVHQLIARDEPTRVLVRSPERLGPVGLQKRARLEVARGDLLEPSTLDAALEGIDRVYHIAGFISTSRRHRQALHRLNHEATVNLFAAARRAGVRRTVYLASIFALGAPKPSDHRPVDEDVRYNLADASVEYFRAKRRAELHAYRCLDEGDPLVLVYPCFCYGPGDVNVSSSRLIQSFLDRKLPAYIPGGQNVMDVRDAARGLLGGMDRGVVGDQYIVGGANCTNQELLERLARLTGYPAPRLRIPRTLGRLAGRVAETLLSHPPLDEQSALVLGGHWYYDDRKARRELDHTSRPLDETLTDSIRWFCDTGRCRWPPGFSRQ